MRDSPKAHHPRQKIIQPDPCKLSTSGENHKPHKMARRHSLNIGPLGIYIGHSLHNTEIARRLAVAPQRQPARLKIPRLPLSHQLKPSLSAIVVAIMYIPSVPRAGAVLTALLLFSPPVTAQAPRTFSLHQQPEYNLLSGCGKTCMYGPAAVWIGGKLGCSDPYTNDCMCRLDKAPSISSYASECNKNLCTGFGDVQQDISTFLSLYNTYCAKNGYTLPGAVELVAPTGDHTVVGDPTAATVTRITKATVTATGGGGATRGATDLGKWGGFVVGVMGLWVGLR